MKAKTILILSVIASLVVCFELILGRNQAEALQLLSEQNARSEQQMRQLKRDQKPSPADLEAARNELAVLQAAGREIDPGLEGNAKVLLVRTTRLRALFGERTELAIPELELLTAVDWLKVARDADLETEPGIRRAMSTARYRATEQFYAKLKPALAAYGSTRSAWPGAVNELAADLVGPLNPAYFHRYRMLIDGEVIPATLRAAFEVIAEAEPVDPQYDLTQLSFNVSGGTNRTPWAMVPLRDAMQAGRLASARANGGRINGDTSNGDYSSYVQPPFQQLMRARTRFVAEMKHRGPIEGTMLAPYLSTDEDRALAEKIWPKLETAK